MSFKHFLQLNEWIVFPKDQRKQYISELKKAKLLLQNNKNLEAETLILKLYQKVKTNLSGLMKSENFSYDFETEYNFSKEFYEKLYLLNKNSLNSRLQIIPFQEFSKHFQ